MSGSFHDYFDATAERPPRPTLLVALDRFDGARGFAVDLGCGQGRDTIELLRRGWSVLAIDAAAEAIRRLASRADLPPGARLDTMAERFEDAVWPIAQLVNASFALPLCPPSRFPTLWRKIIGSLSPGGRFAGQLYGERDGWAGKPGITHHDCKAVSGLLTGLETELLEEEESDTVTPRGKRKHWHIFHIVARRPR
jgi:tellurite methyltransferase